MLPANKDARIFKDKLSKKPNFHTGIPQRVTSLIKNDILPFLEECHFKYFKIEI